jgi:hypothetical protein
MFGLLGWQARLAEVALIAGLLTGGYFYVHHKGYSEAMQDVAIAQEKIDKAQREKYDKLAQELEDTKKKRQENVRTITKTVEKIIDNPIYRNMCISDSGLSVANASLKGESAPKLDDSLSAPTTP